jgi:hypothetical protein
MVIHPQASALPAAAVDAALVAESKVYAYGAGKLCVAVPVAKMEIIGVVTGVRKRAAPSAAGSTLPLRQMRTYFRHDTQPFMRTDAYSAKDVIVAYLDVGNSPFAAATTGADATAALVQAYDGGNNIQVLCVALEDMLPGEEVVLLE